MQAKRKQPWDPAISLALLYSYWYSWPGLRHTEDGGKEVSGRSIETRPWPWPGLRARRDYCGIYNFIALLYHDSDVQKLFSFLALACLGKKQWDPAMAMHGRVSEQDDYCGIYDLSVLRDPDSNVQKVFFISSNYWKRCEANDLMQAKRRRPDEAATNETRPSPLILIYNLCPMVQRDYWYSWPWPGLRHTEDEGRKGGREV